MNSQSVSLEDATREDMTAATLKVPGASLYYETRGSGPVLLIIPGGPQDAGVFADVARHLADRYTVVAYDPRGNSRSTFDSAPQEQDLDIHGDDAARLIAALGEEPAYVFGTSGGAQIGLNLAARHPDRVRALVAHEPPSMMMLDDPSPALAGMRDLHHTYRSQGVEAAMRKFFTEHGLSDGAGPEEARQDDASPQDEPPQFVSTPEEAETFVRVSGNFDYWLAHGIMPLSLYRPDVEALRGRLVVVGIGEGSVGQPIDGMGKALAEKLGTRRVAFPGDHMGFAPYPDRFAETLHWALSGALAGS
ncbi:alpha/beta hydrolase [Mesorhizobium sp. AR10]|uniref:alpha/beta hydrolase n=1 Tax=Mesorhizobium sp. AR10 TaxID=2865839 RepID=UPI00215E6D94|nr:alpha/beta hydrolase [Mesorhizobium sp. AR10]UVK39466.1 alpha/beta hydrolase [Mesorhizobium sp. AR10]